MRDGFLEFQEPWGRRSPSPQRHLTIMEEGQRSDRPAVLSRFPRFKSRYGCCLLLPASKSRTQSSSTERQEDRGRETSAVSPSLSPPLGPLWQHLLPPLHFPIMQWACPLCCPPSFIVLANHCPYQAVPTMHQWWPEGAGETGASEGMTPSNTMSLTPRETVTINKIQTKTMLRHLFKGEGDMCSVAMALTCIYIRQTVDKIKKIWCFVSLCELMWLLYKYFRTQRIGRNGQREGRRGERLSEGEKWSSGKRSEPGPWGRATDEVAE